MGIIGLLGNYEHTIDSNGRLSIPVKFREYITAYSERSVVMTPSPVDACVVVYPLPAWNAITQRLANMGPVVGGTGNDDFLRRKDFLRIFYSRAVDSTLDKQGRILLPASLREIAGLERDTIVTGCENFFEIWDTNKWRQKNACILEDKERLQEAMASLGI